jgi:hypothetical protein
MDQAAACIASVVLPQTDSVNDAQANGTALHDYLCNVLGMGREEALLLVSEQHRDVCEALDLSRLPITDAGGWAGEVAIAYDAVKDAAREVGRNINRAYGSLADSEIPLTLDVLGIAEDTAVVLDYKSGRTQARAAKDNGQLRLGALAACRCYGTVRARVGIVRLFPDGGSWIDWAEFDEMEIDSIALDVAELQARALAARIAFTQKREPPAVVEGPHCERCNAFAWCPAKARLALQMAIAPQEIDCQVAQLTDAQAGVALERMRAVRDLVERVEAALKERARAAPIPLPNGNSYAQVEVAQERLRAPVVLEVMTRLHGATAAAEAVEMKTSKAAVEEVLKAIAKARKEAGEKVTIKAVVNEAMDAVRAADGVYSYTSLQVREIKTKES